MADNNRTQRVNRHEISNPPLPRHRRRPRNHNARTRKAKHKRPLESPQQPRKFFEERRVFDFFSGGAPTHVNLEEMADEGLRDVNGDSAEEDGEEEEPFEILEDGAEEGFLG